ncbi:cytidine deaminase [Alkalicella caledoniensis]|uniref:Cytidine deaminase n=1 Tax=Alkalicella caledoniensis TaxID=2731377 RepID=A0A7G9W9Z2_ALKCA|nr:cytidine deaminase [Alkalicella caledoniensis]QNO15504.1 cytidine deaminase [Alkalicella caledoniensis]
MDFSQLKALALSKVNPRRLSNHCHVASVACALETDTGNIYTGVCIDTACGMGFCAEHAAIAQMITKEESHIVRIVAVSTSGQIYPPCGRCREFMFQVDPKNLAAEIMISEEKIVELEELLPYRWEEKSSP